MQQVTSHESISNIDRNFYRNEIRRLVLEHSREYNWELSRSWTTLYKSVESNFPELGDLRIESAARGVRQLDYIEQMGYLVRVNTLAKEIFKKKRPAELLNLGLARIARARQRIENAIILLGDPAQREFILRRL